MSSVTFIYLGTPIKIQCLKKEFISNIIDRFFLKMGFRDTNSFKFLYNGNILNQNLTFEQIENYGNTILVIQDLDYKEESYDEIKEKIKVKIHFLNKISEIICEPKEKMGNIYQKFSIINCLDKNSIYLWYNKRTIVQNVGIQDYLNFNGGNKNEMEIYATLKKNDNSIKMSNQVFCPICGESAIMKLKNYKISICECKYDHKINDLNINEFETSQLINESNIKCFTCGKNKYETYKNQFYVCKTCNLDICPICKVSHEKDHIIIRYEKQNFNSNIDESNIKCFTCGKKYSEIFGYLFFICETCNIGICPLCKISHGKNHRIISYENQNFMCDEHNETYVSYCKNCKSNLCSVCMKDHFNHNIIRLFDLLIKNEDSENKLKEFKNSIDKFKKDIKKIMYIINKVFENCEKFYNIFKNNLAVTEKKNYYILQNLNEFCNDDFSVKINNIINYKNYNHKMAEIFKMYNCMFNNELNIDEQSQDIKELINKKDKIIIEQKEREKILIQKLEKLENDEKNMKYNSKKVNELLEEINKKNIEIEQLHSYIPFRLAPGEKLMTVIFTSSDQKIHYSFICKNTDKFKDLESKLYDIYPEYSENDNYFLSNGRKIIRFKDLDYNKIKNSDIITLYYETD